MTEELFRVDCLHCNSEKYSCFSIDLENEESSRILEHKCTECQNTSSLSIGELPEIQRIISKAHQQLHRNLARFQLPISIGIRVQLTKSEDSIGCGDINFDDWKCKGVRIKLQNKEKARSDFSGNL